MTSIRPIPAVNGVILNERKEVLLTRRSSVVREPGKWCLPGGHFDGGEDWQKACARELNEEIGITVREMELIGVYSDPKLTVTDSVLGDGFLGQFLVLSFLVTRFDGPVVPNEEVDEWGYFPQDELPEPILKSHPIRVFDAIAFKGKVFVR